MAINQHARIENAIKEMFEVDKNFYEKVGKCDDELQSWLLGLHEGCCDIACRLLGVPEDNWDGIVTDEELAQAEKEMYGLFNAWMEEETVDKFIEIARDIIKEHAEWIYKHQKENKNVNHSRTENGA